MKYWLLSLFVIAGCGGALTFLVRAKVIPRFLASANEEMVADWHAGLTQCREETGSWPDPADAKAFGEKVYIILGADGRRIPGGYMHGRPGRFFGGQVWDVYDQPMRFNMTGETLLVASAGPNQTWGDADDVTSDRVTERYQSATLAQAREQARKRAESESRPSRKK